MNKAIPVRYHYANNPVIMHAILSRLMVRQRRIEINPQMLRK